MIPFCCCCLFQVCLVLFRFAYTCTYLAHRPSRTTRLSNCICVWCVRRVRWGVQRSLRQCVVNSGFFTVLLWFYSNVIPCVFASTDTHAHSNNQNNPPSLHPTHSAPFRPDKYKRWSDCVRCHCFLVCSFLFLLWLLLFVCVCVFAIIPAFVVVSSGVFPVLFRHVYMFCTSVTIIIWMPFLLCC